MQLSWLTRRKLIPINTTIKLKIVIDKQYTKREALLVEWLVTSNLLCRPWDGLKIAAWQDMELYLQASNFNSALPKYTALNISLKHHTLTISHSTIFLQLQTNSQKLAQCSVYLVDKHLHTTKHFTSGHRLSIGMFTLDAQSIRIGILRRGMHIKSALIVFILYFWIHGQSYCTWHLRSLVMQQVRWNGIPRGNRTLFVAKLCTAVLEVARRQEVTGDCTKKKRWSGDWSVFLSLLLSNLLQPLLWTFDNSQVCSRRDSVNCFKGTEEAFIHSAAAISSGTSYYVMQCVNCHVITCKGSSAHLNHLLRWFHRCAFLECATTSMHIRVWTCESRLNAHYRCSVNRPYSPTEHSKTLAEKSIPFALWYSSNWRADSASFSAHNSFPLSLSTFRKASKSLLPLPHKTSMILPTWLLLPCASSTDLHRLYT